MDKENKSQSEQEIVSPNEMVPAKSNSMELIGDADLLGVYDEIMGKLRNNGEQVSELVDTFSEMVINEGDSTTSSKESLVNLVKQKTDIVDKMTKVAELMTRVKLKQPYGEGKAYLNKGGNGSGQNTINIYDQGGFNKKSLLDSIDKAKNKENK